MEKQKFSYNIFLKIFFIAAFFGVGLFIVWFFSTDFLKNTREHSIFHVFGLLVYYYLITMYAKDYVFTEILIDDSGIYKKEFLSSVYIHWSEIKHFQKGKNGIFIYAKKENDQVVFIDKKLHKFKKIIGILSLKIKEIEEEIELTEKEELKNAALSNPHFGKTDKQKIFLMNVFKYGNYLIWIISVLIFFWLSLFEVNLELALTILILSPIIIYILLKFFGNYFSFANFNGIEKLDLSSAVIFTLICLFIYSYSGCSFYEIYTILFISLALGVVFTLQIVDISKIEKMFSLILISFCIPSLICSLYFFCTIKITNIYFNNSNPTIFKVKIVDKYAQKGKSKTYYLVLDKWHTKTEQESEDVNQEFYDKIKIGDSIQVNLYNGRLGLPFYTKNISD